MCGNSHALKVQMRTTLVTCLRIIWDTNSSSVSLNCTVFPATLTAPMMSVPRVSSRAFSIYHMWILQSTQCADTDVCSVVILTAMEKVESILLLE